MDTWSDRNVLADSALDGGMVRPSIVDVELVFAAISFLNYV